MRPSLHRIALFKPSFETVRHNVNPSVAFIAKPAGGFAGPGTHPTATVHYNRTPARHSVPQ